MSFDFKANSTIIKNIPNRILPLDQRLLKIAIITSNSFDKVEKLYIKERGGSIYEETGISSFGCCNGIYINIL